MTAMRKIQKKQAIYTKRKNHELSHVLLELETFCSYISYGFSDNNWTMAARIYNHLQGHLLQSDREKLAEIWREAFVSKDKAKTISDISLLKSKIISVG